MLYSKIHLKVFLCLSFFKLCIQITLIVSPKLCQIIIADKIKKEVLRMSWSLNYICLGDVYLAQGMSWVSAENILMTWKTSSSRRGRAAISIIAMLIKGVIWVIFWNRDQQLASIAMGLFTKCSKASPIRNQRL